MNRPALVVVGAGAVGTAVGRALAATGWPVAAVACRSEARARERAGLVGAGNPCSIGQLVAAAPPPGAAGAQLLYLTVPDRALGEVAARLATRAWPTGSVALHASGAVEVAVLAPLSARGVALGGLHLLKSFVDPDRDAASLAGTVAAIDGEPAAVAAAGELAAALALRPFRLAPGTRALWHAAAAHACNHFVALVDQAVELMGAAGLPPDEARAALLPLLRGTLDNLAAHAPAGALTGPVARGDEAVVAAHLGALRGAAPDVRAAYLALARRAVGLARARGLADERIDALLAILAAGTDDRGP